MFQKDFTSALVAKNCLIGNLLQYLQTRVQWFVVVVFWRKIMGKVEMLNIALKAIEKKITYDNLYYSDYMYGFETKTEDVWEFVSECEEIGLKAFKEKYKKELGGIN